ncbi:MAG TPA: DapH/DapD/GlmU-related protein, partial [Bacteroidia bacterium]|nr:DapH/DapD/GlmU-related protein [Bacteroidia bacterium]
QTRIGRGVWIMPNVTIAPGITIGDEAVIATGSVVTKDVPPRCLAAGVPAKVVKDFSDHEAFKSGPLPD